MTRKYQAECSVPVKRAVMVQTWENLVYLHWAYEPEQVQSLLQAALELAPLYLLEKLM